ncbi:MAG: leucine-rich repeat protein [Solobacterium sp.]|nr:leucine-rich repeat protein [Solobacterium sp.]
MFGKKHQFIVWLLSVLLCFSSLNLNTAAEENIFQESDDETTEMVSDENNDEEMEAEPEPAENQNDNDFENEGEMIPTSSSEEETVADDEIINESEEISEDDFPVQDESEKVSEDDFSVQDESEEISEVPDTAETEYNAGLQSSGDYEYRLLYKGDDENGNKIYTAGILKYTGEESIIHIPREIGGYEVTEIGSSAFRNNSSTQSVYLFDITNDFDHMVSQYAFADNPNLSYIVIPDGWSLNYNTLTNCPQLKTAGKIGSGSNIEFGWKNAIPERSFAFCGSLESVFIPEGITSIDNQAFVECTNLVSVKLPDDLVTIGDGVFADCPKLDIAELPENVKKIGYTSFGRCSSIKTMVIPQGVKELLGSTFTDCSGLTEIILPDTMTRIGDTVFKNCTMLERVNIPSSLTGLGSQAFYGCSKLNHISLPQGVTVIDEATFLGCRSLNDFSFAGSITKIGYKAFAGSNITDFEMPNTVTSLGNNVFQNCGNLESVTLSNSLRTIPEYTFDGCEKLSDIMLPSRITMIGDDAFRKCKSLTEIIVPDTVTNIGSGAFFGCEKLKNIIIHDGVTSIGNSAFSGCISLTNITIPDSVSSLGSWGFSGCENLTSITLPDNITNIEEYTFELCSSLTSIRIPDSIVNIGPHAFDGCRSLTGITLPDGTVSIGEYAFVECSSLTSIMIPDSVTSIGEYAFRNCNVLTDVIIPHNLKRIEEATFQGCSSLKTVTIPLNLVFIGNSAFYRCRNISDVFYEGSETDWELIEILENNEDLLNARFQYNYQYEIPAKELLIQTGEFTYFSGITDRLEQYRYDYDENWFTESSEAYNHDLARMSVRMAVAAFGVPSAKQHLIDTYEKDENTLIKYMATESKKSSSTTIVQLLKNLEFTDVEVNYPSPQTNSIGFAVGSKAIKDAEGEEFTLIAVAVRGGTYYNEWSGNFNVGDEGIHDGFNIAASQVFNSVKRYINNLNRSNVKVWITGYSRAAATANLVGQKVISAANGGTLDGVKSDGVFTYCFECPRNVTKQYMAEHGNPAHIFSIVNESDLVTHVAFKKWKFSRFGTVYYLPSLEASGFNDYPFAWSAMFYKYKDIIQAMGYSEKEADDLAVTYAKLGPAQEGTVDSIADLIADIGYDPEWYVEHYQDTVTNVANDLFDIRKKEYKDIKDILITNVVISAIEDLLMKGFSSVVSYNAIKTLVRYVGSGLAKGHYPELCMAWLDTLDGTEDYYSSDTRERLLVLNCPVDVDVYYQGQLAGRILNDEAVDIGGNSLCVFVDHNGQKKVYLPVGDDYEIRITARDSGKMSYQIEERDIDSGELYRIVNYIDVDVTKDDQLTGTVSAMDENGLSHYNLYSPDGAEITPTMDLNDNIAHYYVKLNASGKGSVNAGGQVNIGEYFKASAEAEEGSVFIGWYIDDQLISKEAEYRFCVLEDTELTAVFRSIVLDKYQLILGIGESYQIMPVIEPAFEAVLPTDEINGDYTWSSSDDEIAAVDGNGLVTGKKTGNAVITVAAKDGSLTATCNVFVEFVDVRDKTAFYYNYVYEMAGKGIVTGWDDGTFRPYGNCNRAAVVTFLWRLDGKPEPGKMADFKDMTGNTDFDKAISWAAEQGITTGWADGTFRPWNTCNRAAIITFLWRYAGAPETEIDSSFSDMTGNADFDKAISWGVANGITTGWADGTFRPWNTCNRLAVVSFLGRYNELKN